MKKIKIEFRGKKYAAREIDLSPIVEGYGTVTVADYELSEALREATKDFKVDDQEADDIDADIYCYLDSGTVASDPTDAELLWDIAKTTGEDDYMTDQHYYNLMRLCDHEIGAAHELGAINMNVECYEMDGDYTAYTYGDGFNWYLYDGPSARECCLVMLAAVTMLSRSNTYFKVALWDDDSQF